MFEKLQEKRSDIIQAVKQLLDLVLDARNPRPTFSTSLLQLGDIDGAISNVLPIIPTILSDTSLSLNVSRKLADGGEDVTNIRALFTDILEATLILSEHYVGTKGCQWPQQCCQNPSSLTDFQ